MTAYEPHVGARYITTKLRQNAEVAAIVGTRVYTRRVPADAGSPYILITPVSMSDHMVVGADRVMVNIWWQIEAWSRTTDSAVTAQIAALIDETLHDTSGTMTGAEYGAGLVIKMWRIAPLMGPLDADIDPPWMRDGAEYRQLVQSA